MVAISIVVPVYNGLRFLPDTIDSILEQTFKDFELILLNDGSTDRSAEYLQSITDPRVRILHQENRGLCASMNRLLAVARAPVIARNDQDDISTPDRIARQLQELQAARWDLLFCMIYKIGEKRAWWNNDQEQARAGEVVPLVSLRDGAKVHSTLMARAEPYRELGYRAPFYPCDDWDLQLRAEERYKVGLLKEKLVGYRFHEQAATHRGFQKMQIRSRWAEACALARRSGVEEMSLEAHVTMLRAQPLWRRANRARKDAYRWAQRAGGERWLNSSNLRAYPLLLLALLLAPERLLRRLTTAFRTSIKANFRT